MSTTKRRSYDSFWRCDHCGTPNPATGYLTNCLGCGKSRETVLQAKSDPPPPGSLAATIPVQIVTPKVWKERMRLLIATLVYSVAVFVASAMVRIAGDAWWPSLFLIMSPRWIFLFPVPVLLFFAWRLKRRPVAVILLMDVLFVLGPMMGFGIPWGRIMAETPEGPTVRMMTFNRGGGLVDVPRLSRYIERQKIDVICFQDFKPDTRLDAYLDGAGWHHNATRTIVSRFPIVLELPRPPEENMDQDRYTMTLFRARIKPPVGPEFVVASVQLPTLRHGLNRLFVGNVTGFRKQAKWWKDEFYRMGDFITEDHTAPMLIGGDFNMPIESRHMYALIGEGLFKSAFETAGFGWGYTRPSSFSWVRIDHIFTSPDCTPLSCWVGPDFGSDHRSLISEIALPPAEPEKPTIQPAQP